MNKLIFSLLFVCTFLSCGDKKETLVIPSHILSKEKMARVITDIHIAEAELNAGTLPDSTSKLPIGFQEIFDINSVTKQQYEESLTFYIDHPLLLDSIYTQVLNDLSKMQGAPAGK